MGNFRPINTKHWVKFLEAHGYTLNRITASHYQYTKRGSRTIPVWGDEKEIPPFHIKTACANMQISMDEVYKWIDKNC